MENPLYSNQYNFSKINWDQVRQKAQRICQENIYKDQTDNISLLSEEVMEEEATKLKDLITKCLESIPKKKVTEYSKP